MSLHRIEISFVADAPETEWERARIVAGEKVIAAIKALQEALVDAGAKAEVTVQSVRTTKGRPRKPQPPQMRVQGAQAAE